MIESAQEKATKIGRTDNRDCGYVGTSTNNSYIQSRRDQTKSSESVCNLHQSKATPHTTDHGDLARYSRTRRGLCFGRNDSSSSTTKTADCH
eukprot:scaffold27479_cov83-Skeletonema_dohrnii-CCMP3373.AAC.1